MKRCALWPIPILLLSACGSESPDAPDAGTARTIFPMAVGNEWEFQLKSGSGVLSSKVQTVTGTASVGGTRAFVFRTERGDNVTESAQSADAEGRILRHYEIETEAGLFKDRVLFEPPALRVHRNKLAIGDTYTSSFEERHVDERGNMTGPRTPKSYSFEVEAVDEDVQVPAGTFRCVRIRRDSANDVVKTYWYAVGVGKVKEIGGQTEELVRYTAKEE